METENIQQSTQQFAQEIVHDRVLTASRVLAAIIVPVLVAAFIILYLFPNDTGRLFAWPIKPTMSAMMLGATYLGGAYFFTRVVFARQWHTVRLGFLPVTLFAAILGIATALHWDKFNHGQISFMLWSLLYFTLPFVIPMVWFINQRATRGEVPEKEKPLSAGFRLAIGILGGTMLAASAILLISPGAMIPVWSWSLTPLTARVMAAMFVLPGFVGVSVAVDGRWSSASIIFQAQVISILLILLGAMRATGEIQWGTWGSWVFLTGLGLELVLIGWAALQVRVRKSQS
jgi:hypothetical protein